MGRERGNTQQQRERNEATSEGCYATLNEERSLLVAEWSSGYEREAVRVPDSRGRAGHEPCAMCGVLLLVGVGGTVQYGVAVARCTDCTVRSAICIFDDWLVVWYQI